MKSNNDSSGIGKKYTQIHEDTQTLTDIYVKETWKSVTFRGIQQLSYIRIR